MSDSFTHQFDALLGRLRNAIRAKDGEVIADTLQTLENILVDQSPAIRATAYAQVQAEVGKPQLAASAIEDLLAVVGDDPKLWFQLGSYRQLAEQYEAAEQALATAVKLDPALHDAWLDLGILLDRRGDPEGAIDCYRPVLARRPEDPVVWRNLGNSLAALQRFREARDAYTTALGLRPGDPTIALLRASALQATGDIDEANQSLTATLLAEFGTIVQVEVHRDKLDYRCRFHATPTQQVLAVDIATQLLQSLARTAAKPGFCSEFDVFVVEQGSYVTVCDRDPYRPHHPNRFFDATTTILKQMRQPKKTP